MENSKDGHFLIGGSEENPDFIISDGEDEISIAPNNLFMEHNYQGERAWVCLQKGGFGCGTNDGGERVSIWGHEDPLIKLSGIDTQTTVMSSGIKTPSLIQTSIEEAKKNISAYNGRALKIIKNADVYNYNLKSEKNTDKKRIGFVIGEKYRTPKEIIAKSEDGIDLYAMASILWKAVQELTDEVEQLQQELKK